MEAPRNGSFALDPGIDSLLAEFYRRAVERCGGRLTLRDWVDLTEAWRIIGALRECRGNRSAAARSLGIGRRTLYTKMEKLGIQPSWEAAPLPAERPSAPAP